MSICRVFSCVVGRGCLLWPVRSFGKTLLAFALLHFVLQGQICLLLQASLPQISQVAQTAKCLPTMRETWVQSLGWEDLLEKEMATHSSVLAWKVPWTEEPGRLQSMRLQRVGHDWMTSLSGISWLPTFTFQSPIMRRTSFGVLVLEGLVGLHRTIQLQLLQHYWLGHRLGLLWYWMACLRNKQRSFCCFLACIWELHFKLFCWLGGLLYFF